MKFIYIKWFDASYQRGECTEEELNPSVVIESAGLLVKETATTVTIALDRYADNGTWRYIEHIPRCNILKMRKVKL